MGIGFPVHPAQELVAALAGLGPDRHHRHGGQLVLPARAIGGFEHLAGVAHGFAAAEGDGIEAVLLQGRHR